MYIYCNLKYVFDKKNQSIYLSQRYIFYILPPPFISSFSSKSPHVLPFFLIIP